MLNASNSAAQKLKKYAALSARTKIFIQTCCVLPVYRFDVQNEDEENGIEEPHSPLCENDFMEADLDEINVQTLTSENSG